MKNAVFLEYNCKNVFGGRGGHFGVFKSCNPNNCGHFGIFGGLIATQGAKIVIFKHRL
jgi:hypothetical protein